MATGKLQVFYDGACPLCRREMGHYQVKDRRHNIDWVNIAGADFHADAYGLDPARVQQVMHARTPEGKVVTEVAAFLAIWKALPNGWIVTPLKWFFSIPGMVWVGGFFYRAFARNRYRLTGRCTAESCALPLDK